MWGRKGAFGCAEEKHQKDKPRKLSFTLREKQKKQSPNPQLTK